MYQMVGVRTSDTKWPPCPRLHHGQYGHPDLSQWRIILGNLIKLNFVINMSTALLFALNGPIIPCNYNLILHMFGEALSTSSKVVDMNTLVTANKFHHFYKRIFIGCKLFIINHLRKFMVNTSRGGTGKTSTMYQVIFWEPASIGRVHYAILFY